MPRVPFVSRLHAHEYLAVLVSLILAALESVLHIVILFLPRPIIAWFHDRSKLIFHRIAGAPAPRSAERRVADKIRKAQDFQELCRIFGYHHEDHVVLTKDGYCLGLHRLPARKGQAPPLPGIATNKPVVYLHHGLLMNSEVWVCLTDPQRSLPFVLAELGFDVWLGNNRGNKYSKKSIHYDPNSTKFWDFSIDDFAWRDIPDSIQYILDLTHAKSLSYIGFSQGTAQAFAALSIHPELNQRVNLFIALAPAMSPAGLAAPLVDGLMKASPTLLFLIFGRRAILSSAIMWQQILYPPIFSRVLDVSLDFLFSWRSKNITPTQKLAAYAHLYSFASTKSVVHWFQIMRNARFLMYDDDAYAHIHLPSPSISLSTPAQSPSLNALSSRKTKNSTANTGYSPATFPTRNISTSIVLLYGDTDSLVDIDTMLAALPPSKDRVEVRRLHGYEHLDVIWGKDVHKDVIPHVIEALMRHGKEKGIAGMDSIGAMPEGLNGLDGAEVDGAEGISFGTEKGLRTNGKSSGYGTMTETETDA
ncbi:triacylglycerol lipase [Stereum hirsutum FP-91666 SS1]|uniref:triacylglycerol lipase n=1 Tax=Stereum hirsutum (strain FP-91666) TaxID=721885 RepID=UPI000444A874|nr:triacylglycerol lipase [Stereum hirsutum FP-91666 SS1]EIM80542.1 triacylglycerol lipase [Stereum hirsutum FP-91666 SS1]